MNYVRLLLLPFLLIACKNNTQQAESLFDFVPQNTIAIVQVNDFNVLKNTLTNQKLIKSLSQLDSRLKKTIEALTPETVEGPALYCFTSKGKSQITVSLVYGVKEKDSLSLKNHKSILYNGENIKIIEKESKTAYEIQLNTTRIVSDSQLILENSIRNYQNNQQKQLLDPSLSILAENIDQNASLNLLIHSSGKQLFEILFPQTPLFPMMNSSWSAFDFNSKRDPFTLDGVVLINDSIPELGTLIKGLGNKPLQNSRVVPTDYKSFLSLAVDNIEFLQNNFKSYAQFKNLALNTIDFTPYSTVDEIGWMAFDNSNAIVFHVNNTQLVDSELLDTQNPKYFNKTPYYKGDLSKEMLGFINVLGLPFVSEWVVLLDDFLVYSDSEYQLKRIISNYYKGEVLENETDYQKLKEAIADNASYLWVGHAENLKREWQSLSQSPQKEHWDTVNTADYPLIALQAVSEDNLIQLRFTAQAKSLGHSNNSASSQYSFSLDAPMATQPQWLKNHRTKAMDIAVQDTENVLYLFSNTGTLFWKKQLEEKILGPIQQVDLYKNGRLQMAFRTENKLMILDRNGKVVAPFNIKVFPQKPMQPLAVFDYDRNRDYRFLISNGKSLVMYDSKGKRVTGFGLNQLEHPLLHPPKHFRIANRDYIVLQQTDGTLRIVSRTGKDRIAVTEKINFSLNPIYNYLNKFSTTDLEGNLLQINTKGKISYTSKALSASHLIDMTAKSMVSLSDNVLTIKGIPVELNFGTYTPPKIFYINNTIFVTTTNTEENAVYMFYSNGKAVGGFPIYGASSIDLTNADGDKPLELVVQSEKENMLIYELNLSR